MPSDGPRSSRAIFRLPEFRYYAASRFLWSLGQQIQAVAVGWLVYDITRDPLALGFIGLAGFIPAVPLSLLGGPVADRYDRRSIVVVCYIAMTLAAFGLCITAFSQRIWPIYGFVILLGAARAFSLPAIQSILPTLVPESEFPSAVGWANSISQVATIIGPSLGGLLYPFGAVVPFAFACVVFAASAILAALVRPGPPRQRKEPVNIAMLVAGYRLIWNRPLLLGIMTLDFVAVLLGGATALLPIYARDIFHTGPWGLGLLRTMPSIGAITAAFILAHRPMNKNVGLTMFVSVMLFGLATIGFGLSTSLFVAMPFLILLGVTDMTSVVIRQSLIQIATPNDMRGRVSGVHGILTGTSNQLGEFESGSLAALVGTVPSVVIGGVGAFLAAVIWMWMFPDVRKRQGMSVSEES